MMEYTIQDLLNNLVVKTPTLENNKDTWQRIGRRDSFEELGISGSELESFLTEWMKNNEYS